VLICHTFIRRQLKRSEPEASEPLLENKDMVDQHDRTFLNRYIIVNLLIYAAKNRTVIFFDRIIQCLSKMAVKYL
jgi:hypothetical protein